MLADLVSIPGAGGFAAAGLVYAGVSLFVSGPLVGERTIDKSGWPARCTRQALAEPEQDAPGSVRNLDCGAILGLLYGRDGKAFCERHADALTLPFGVLGAMQDRHQAAARARVAEQTAASGSRCACAVATVLELRRVDLALYAGTARLVTPLFVRLLDAELGRAAGSPACTAKG